MRDRQSPRSAVLRENGPVKSIRNQQVIGSSPIAGSNRINNFH
jgi:hypothetical protein